MSRTLMLWLLWIVMSVSAAGVGLAAIWYGGNRSIFLIGKTTSGHHQIELACDACHTSVFGGPEILQNACVQCHGAELRAANDAHPQSKFTDPRNIERTAVLDARNCVTCHREHRPDITKAMAVTLPDDFCFKCHEDIGKERPSHKDLAFTTCASAGCHNFHDNRALYMDFLITHAKEPDQLKVQKAALVNFLNERKDSIKVPKALTAQDADAPDQYKSPAAIDAWAADAHARMGVNCSGCHTTKDAPSTWIAAPDLATCKGCHTQQAQTFVEGKHGMRLRDGLFASHADPLGLFKERKLTAMTPAEARLPMKADHATVALGCNTCHSAHAYNLNAAKVEACAGCHDDQHTRAYFSSPHYDLFKKEIAGELPKGSGVSCATCHMPVTEIRDANGQRFHFITHNQNDNLRPNEKMVRSACIGCHGLQFTLDSLADPALIERNFKGRSTVHIESIEWAQKRIEERRRQRKQKLQSKSN
jgi:predicted CXXCH cytochrome family protein